MAKKRPTKRPKKPKPFDPMASPFKTQKGFNKAVKTRARAEIQPQLNDVKARTKTAAGAHSTRTNEIGGYYGTQQAGLQAASTQLNDAYQNLIKASGVQFGNAGDALSAALRQSTGANDAEAARLGGVNPNLDPAITAAQASNASGNQMGLLGDLANNQTRVNANIGIGALGQREAGQQEMARYQTEQQGLGDERKALFAQIPALRGQIRGDLMNQELARSGQVFQQNLAGREFGETSKMNKFQRKLARRQQHETERSNRAGERSQNQQIANQYTIDQGQLDVQRSQLDQDIKDATTKEDKERAKLRGDRFNNGVEILSNALDPSPYIKGGKLNKKQYEASIKGRFGEIMQRIQSVTGMGDLEALKVMMTSANPGWAHHATQLYWRGRAKKKAQKLPAPPKKPTPPNKLPGLTGGFPGNG